jgi:MFS family permease
VTVDKNLVRGLVAATGATAMLGATIGLAMVLLSLVLEQRGFSEGEIGLSAAAQFLGIMGFSPLAPWIMRRIGLFRSIAVSLIVCSICLAAFPVFTDYGAWLVIRLIFGGAEALLFVASETWINEAVPERLRGRMVALYGTMLAIGFAAGPLIVSATGTTDATPFYVGAVVVAAGLIPLVIGIGVAPAFDESPSSKPFAVFTALPVAAGSAALFGLLDGGLFGLLAVYGVEIGFTTRDATHLVTALVLGGIVLQIPIGLLADRIDRTLVLTGCAALGTILLIALPVAVDFGWALHLVLLVLGGLLGSFWIMAMTLLGQRYRGADLAAGNVGLTIAYGIGSVTGPVISGYAMEIWHPHGLVVPLAVLTGAFAVFAAGRWRAAKSGQDA